jgi:non-specific serine/threonine protein kinase
VPRRCRLVRRGAVWEVEGGEAAFFLKDAKGLRHLARLLAAPGRDFHALELAAPGTELRAQGDAGPLLDPRAKREYRERITDLEAEIEEAEKFHDPERSSRARAELDFLAHELTAAVGLGGRDRRARADSERARVNVTRAVHAVVERIAEHDERLGHHLRTCVRTGTFCAYAPGPDGPAWEIDSGA